MISLVWVFPLLTQYEIPSFGNLGSWGIKRLIDFTPTTKLVPELGLNPRPPKLKPPVLSTTAWILRFLSLSETSPPFKVMWFSVNRQSLHQFEIERRFKTNICNSKLAISLESYTSKWNSEYQAILGMWGMEEKDGPEYM